MHRIYKTLFEVKLLHEFYQTDREGNSIFELNTQAQRTGFLKERFAANDDNINEDITFEIPQQATELYRNYDLKLLSTYAGYKILISVKPKKLANGTTTYEPLSTLPADLAIPVLVAKKNSHFDGFTDGKMERALPGAYFFSNDSSFSGTRIFPFLSAEISAFDPAQSYEQGEAAKFAANDYRSFYRDDANAAQWVPLAGKAFANENDRILLPTNFYYTFPTASSITKADFVLKDKNGAILQEFHFKSTGAYSKVLLSFDQRLLSTLPSDLITGQLGYTLKVSGSGAYTKTHQILFYQQEKALRNSIGLILIKVKTANNSYNLLDNAGRLITRKKPDNSMDPLPPLFEINFKSRPSFWRYINNKQGELKSGLHPDFLIAKAGTLVSIKPRALTATGTLFRKPDNSLYYLPNPAPYQTLIFEDNKLYSDIMVQESPLFPLAP